MALMISHICRRGAGLPYVTISPVANGEIDFTKPVELTW